ncbi:hypothetical protein QBC42DRAFT_94504 [Cladorrhinum samala]|uniref:Peptidase A1 domain-containing protein n=1 Tax=Cladorrhinum samala TaxID=585594 RepID=A0AAV9HL24_9PEZI|nr:hypothetical protein QBC42DRAFT_94504 [Cladorrhinum samala]
MDNPRLSTILAAILAILATPSDAADGVFQIPFTTDTGWFGDGKFGPDGPWQAAAIVLGTTTMEAMMRNNTNSTWAAMWPSAQSFTALLTSETRADGVYKITGSEAQRRKSWAEYGASGLNPMMGPAHYANQFSMGVGLIDSLTIPDFRWSDPGYANVNVSIYAMNSTWVSPFSPDDLTTSRYTLPPVGWLGLGRPADGMSLLGQFPEYLIGDGLTGDGLIEQMKKDDLVGSRSFGLHMGSAALDQKGSLMVGGYDESRVIEPVGTFEMQLGQAVMTLLDVVLGSEVGGWPFNSPREEVGGIFQGTDDEMGLQSVGMFGRKKGSVLVSPNPLVPGIYLPNNTCANAAKHLPVRFDEKIGYYLWNTEDAAYSRIVGSPAYLGFVFADTSNTNITIKVPFKLLNLTLENPIVDRPTPYLPCHDTGSHETGVWELGRAFLQASFYGVSFDRNLTFLAQAPGPNGDAAVPRALKPEDNTLVSKPASHFADSWSSQWVVLKEDAAKSDAQPNAENGIGGGAIAGIVIGVMAGLALVAVAGWFFWRKRKQQHSGPAELQDSEIQNCDGRPSANREKKIHEMSDTPFVSEMSDSPLVSEMADTPVASKLYPPQNLPELESPIGLSEAPGSAVVYEMAGNETWIEADSTRAGQQDMAQERK